MEISGCSKPLVGVVNKYDMQARVGDIGDAMEHCRGYISYVLDGDVMIHIDQISSREETEYYEIFLELQDVTQEGWAQCRVSKEGTIIYHKIRDFTRQGRSFAESEVL